MAASAPPPTLPAAAFGGAFSACLLGCLPFFPPFETHPPPRDTRQDPPVCHVRAEWGEFEGGGRGGAGTRRGHGGVADSGGPGGDLAELVAVLVHSRGIRLGPARAVTWRTLTVEVNRWLEGTEARVFRHRILWIDDDEGEEEEVEEEAARAGEAALPWRLSRPRGVGFDDTLDLCAARQPFSVVRGRQRIYLTVLRLRAPTADAMIGR